MSGWRGGLNEEGERPLHNHIRWGKSLVIGAECWRLGILGILAGIGRFKATCNRHGSKGQSGKSWKSWRCRAKAW